MSPPRVIVVLGMHRSGTSAIARSLRVLGVSLGDHLMPPRPDNPTGFWEDIDINSLNVEMLARLGSDWFGLSVIATTQLEQLRKEGFYDRALMLVRGKLADTPLFGIKDPRIARLLPFWQRVFHDCGLEVGYILALRHPRSVAESLARRDAIEFEHSYLLWMAHVIRGVLCMRGERWLVVDYDRLMQEPEREIRRIGDSFGLSCDEAELVRYRTTFLDKSLQHTIFDVDVLQGDAACPPLVAEIYTFLLAAARDVSALDGREMAAARSRWAGALEYLEVPLRLADRFLAEREAGRRGCAELGDQVVDLRDSLSHREGEVHALQVAVADREGEINRLHGVVSDREGEIHRLHRVVLERDRQMFSLKSNSEELRQQRDKMLASRSWRITAPMRAVSTIQLRLMASVGNLPKRVYDGLPLDIPAKQRLKALFFTVFGFALARSEAYQRWKVRGAPAARLVAEKRFAQVEACGAGNLPDADGTWEWSDYEGVRARIQNTKDARREAFSPVPPRMLDVEDRDLRLVARNLALPPCHETPDVTILIPVFNHLKLTLECLQSIVASTGPYVSYEVVVADDASTDDTAVVLSAAANLRVSRSETNLGFLRNCNRVLDLARGRYVLFLNNDVQVTDGWLERMLATFSEHPQVGAVGPRIIYPSGHLQEAGVSLRADGTADMVGLNESPEQPRFGYPRRADYVSGACLLVRADLVKELGGFSEEFAPCYCEDGDLCLRIEQKGYFTYINPGATVIHHLSKTTGAMAPSFKYGCLAANLATQASKWAERLRRGGRPRLIAFYLPQFHPIPENDQWWGPGFTEWTNVTKATPNFVGHYQPRVPADLGYYDLREAEAMVRQAELAARYGIHGFCYYYYWFGGKRLLEAPLECMLASGAPDFPFCLCWANENWTRRWDGRSDDILIGQAHSPEDDRAVIEDLARYFKDKRYIRIDGRPLILIYRVTLFPDFAQTAERWRAACREIGVGEIYIALVESFELVHAGRHPREFGCDAAVEFPPQELAETKAPTGDIVNPNFKGYTADYSDLAVRYAVRPGPAYTRFSCAMPGWDNTARQQDGGYCFEHATPGAFQAWLEEVICQTCQQQFGDERLVFINAWNEWAEGAYLEPDKRFGHSFLEAVRNALDASELLRHRKTYALGDGT